VRTLSLEPHYEYPHYRFDLECLVSLEVLNAWADAAQHLFPRLHVVSVGISYASSVADAHAVLRFLTPKIDHFFMTYADDFLLDADETEQLKNLGTGLRNLRLDSRGEDQQAAQHLVSTFISASAHYETVHLSSPLPLSAIPHLGQCPRLRVLSLELVGPALRNISIGAFGALTQLQLHDSTNELPGMHLTLALPSHIRLRSFSYQMAYRETRLNQSSLHRFLHHITRWGTLTSISLSLYIEDDISSLEGYRAIYTHFHALLHLETLEWRSHTPVILDDALFRDILKACSSLAEWLIVRMPANFVLSNDAFEVSLPTFVGLLSSHPNIRWLPVLVRCNEMPCSQEIANCRVSSYEGVLAVTGIEEPDAVAGVLRQVAPRVTRCVLHVPNNEHVDELQRTCLVELNKYLLS
jgi:hypothetical protein